jgi:hypothetical protein
MQRSMELSRPEGQSCVIPHWASSRWLAAQGGTTGLMIVRCWCTGALQRSLWHVLRLSVYARRRTAARAQLAVGPFQIAGGKDKLVLLT